MARGGAAQEGCISRLREACVKAETFTGTEWPEYKTAQDSLLNARVAELEVQARRVKLAHGFPVDPRFNLFLDAGRGPTLLLEDSVGGEGGDHTREGRASRVTLVEVGDDCSAEGVGRRLALDPPALSEGEGGQQERFGGGSGDAVWGGRSSDGASLVCQAESRVSTEIGAREGFGGTNAWAGGGDGGGGDGFRTQLLARRLNAAGVFLAYATKQEERYQHARDQDRRYLRDSEASDLKHQDHMTRLDVQNEQDNRKLTVETKRLDEDLRDREEAARRREKGKNDERLARLWSEDRDFLRLLSLVDAVIAASTVAWSRGFSVAPLAVLAFVWNLVVARCGRPGHGKYVGGMITTAITASSAGAGSGGLSDAAAATGSAVSAACPSPVSILNAATETLMHDASLHASLSESCPGGGWEDTAAAAAAEAGEAGGGEDSGGVAWWAWSTAGSAASAVAQAGYSSVGWLLGQAVGLVAPEVQCEVLEVLLFFVWLLSLMLVLKLVGLCGADGGGSAGAVARLAVLLSWVWGWFHDWLEELSHVLLVAVAPVPAIVLAYGPALKYVEEQRNPGGVWWFRGWDVRPIVSRVLPAVVSCLLAWVLGMHAP